MHITLQQCDSARECALEVFCRICHEEKIWPEAEDLPGLNLDRWEVLPIMDGREPVGACLRMGAEIHVAVVAGVRGRWLTPGVIDILINQTIERYGYVSTRIKAYAPHVIPPPSRLGFVFWKRDEDFIWLWLAEPWRPRRSGMKNFPAIP